MRFFKLFFILIYIFTPIYTLAVVITVNNSKAFHLALKEVCSNNEDSTILLEDGIYATNIENLGTFTYDGIDGKNLTIKSKNGNSEGVIISGENSHRVFLLKSNNTSTLFEIDGVTIQKGFSDGNGSGINTKNPLKIKNSKFLTNSSYNNGGAIYGDKIDIFFSTFTQNRSGYTRSTKNIGDGGGAVYGKTVAIEDSEFTQNSANYGDGGAVYGQIVSSLRSKFTQNATSSQGSAGAVLATSDAYIINSFFKNNLASLDSGSLKSEKIYIVNSTFLDNGSINPPKSIYGRGLVLNSILKNLQYDIKLTGTTHIYNNYLDFPSLQNIDNNTTQTVFMSNNIQILSSHTFLSSDGLIASEDALIKDKGVNPTLPLLSTLLDEYVLDAAKKEYILGNMYIDLAQNFRVAGETIDIGAYEYGALEYNQIPTIKSIDTNGSYLVREPITIRSEILPAKGREIVEISIDIGSGFFNTIDKSSWESEGSSTKVSYTHNYDSDGEYEIRVRAKDDKNEIVLKSSTIKIEKPCVICECDFTPYELNQSDVDVLGLGWHLLGAPKDIDIKSTFPSVSRIWIWHEEDWKVYDKNTSLSQISTIKAKQGFWYFKEGL